jgi:small subunit ribosomal protein S18
MARAARKKDKSKDKRGRGGARGARPGGARPGGGRPRGKNLFARRKGCSMCAKRRVATYRDLEFLSDFVTESGKMLTRRITGICATHQNQVSTSIKRARMLALMPFEKR